MGIAVTFSVFASGPCKVLLSSGQLIKLIPEHLLCHYLPDESVNRCCSHKNMQQVGCLLLLLPLLKVMQCD